MSLRRVVLVSAALLAATLAMAAATAAAQPSLRSVSERNGHVIATFSLGDLAPGYLVVASRARLDQAGRLVAGVRLRERMRPARAGGVLRWRSPAALRPGVYFVQVSGVQVDGVTDCIHPQPACAIRWSNVLRVSIPKGA